MHPTSAVLRVLPTEEDEALSTLWTATFVCKDPGARDSSVSLAPPVSLPAEDEALVALLRPEDGTHDDEGEMDDAGDDCDEEASDDVKEEEVVDEDEDGAVSRETPGMALLRSLMPPPPSLQEIEQTLREAEETKGPPLAVRRKRGAVAEAVETAETVTKKRRTAHKATRTEATSGESNKKKKKQRQTSRLPKKASKEKEAVAVAVELPDGNRPCFAEFAKIPNVAIVSVTADRWLASKSLAASLRSLVARDIKKMPGTWMRLVDFLSSARLKFPDLVPLKLRTNLSAAFQKAVFASDEVARVEPAIVVVRDCGSLQLLYVKKWAD